MQQNQAGPGPRAEVAHARPIEVHPALFHPCAQRRSEARYMQSRNIPARRHHSQFFSLRIFRNPDNFSLSAGLYLNEHRLCSLHLGSSGSPFLNCHLEQLVILSGVTASRQRSCYAVEGSLPSHIPARTPRHFAGRLPLNQARPDPHAATFRFFRNSFFSTRIPLSTCFSSSKNGGKNLTTVSCVELKSTPSAKAASTIGRAGISRLIP